MVAKGRVFVYVRTAPRANSHAPFLRLDSQSRQVYENVQPTCAAPCAANLAGGRTLPTPAAPISRPRPPSPPTAPPGGVMAHPCRMYPAPSLYFSILTVLPLHQQFTADPSLTQVANPLQFTAIPITLLQSQAGSTQYHSNTSTHTSIAAPAGKTVPARPAHAEPPRRVSRPRTADPPRQL
jgi:hypothetical protein